MSVPNFDAKQFYLLENALFTNRTLSGGMNLRNDRKVVVDPVRAYSSENWQLFEQGGRFFIRNFDTGPSLQLGVVRQNLETPLMYEKSGGLSQQWQVTESNGKYKITNALAGKDMFLVVDDNGIVSMQTSSRGSEWLIDMNESAARDVNAPKQPEMFVDVDNFEQLSTSSSIPLSTATSGGVLNSSTSQPTSSGLGGSSGSGNTQIGSSSALSGGAIAGIVIGGIAVLGAIIFAVWFFLRRRKNKQQHKYELSVDQAHQPPHMEKYAYRAELSTPHIQDQAWEADSTQKRPAESRHELA